MKDLIEIEAWMSRNPRRVVSITHDGTGAFRVAMLEGGAYQSLAGGVSLLVAVDQAVRLAEARDHDEGLIP